MSIIADSIETRRSGSPYTAAAGTVPLEQWLGRMAMPPFVSIEVDVIVFQRLRFRSPLAYIVRGLVGDRLRRHSCLTDAPRCDGCRVRRECDYDRLFGSSPEPRTSQGGLGDVHPFWLQGIPSTNEVDVGTRFTARLTAVDLDDSDLQILHFAFREALAALGRSGTGEVAPWLSASRAYETDLRTEPVDAETWWIEALTPVLLTPSTRTAGLTRCPRAEWLPDLVASGVRRLKALAMAAGAGDADCALEYPDFGEVEVIAGGMRPWAGSVISRSQGRGYDVGNGIVGGVLVRGPALARCGGLLGALGVTGVGKKTTMGFGHLRAEPVR